jgi:hypothetical protein
MCFQRKENTNAHKQLENYLNIREHQKTFFTYYSSSLPTALSSAAYSMIIHL